MKNFISPSAMLLAVVTFFAFSNTNAQSKNLLNTQDVLILKGKLVEAETLKSIQQSIVNLDLKESGMLLFDMDENGNYLMVFNKEQLSFPFKMSFNFEGHENFEAKKITAKDDFVKMDIELEPIKEQRMVNTQAKMKKWESNAVVSTIVVKMN